MDPKGKRLSSAPLESSNAVLTKKNCVELSLKSMEIEKE